MKPPIGTGSLDRIDVANAVVGDKYELVLVENLLRTQIVQYAGGSGDFHPYHHDEPHSIADGFDGIFAHGMLTMGISSRIVSELVGDENIQNLRAELRKQVWPGDTLTGHATVSSIDGNLIGLEIETRNQDGAVVLRGMARAELP